MKSDTQMYLFDTPNSKLIIWKDEMYFDKLEQGLKKREIEKQQVSEKLTTIDKGLILKYHPNSAPYAENSEFTHVSISHYRSYFSIYLSKSPIGVDIQEFKDSLVKGKHYFINKSEESALALTKVNSHLIWTAKEAFYKKCSGEIEDLKNEVSIMDIDEAQKLIRLKYQEEIFMLNFVVFNEYVVTWI
jgi:phosphopantetheinyl transferase